MLAAKKINIPLFCVLAALVTLTSVCVAQENTDSRKYLVELVKKGAYQEAFELAERIFDDYVGDPDFDYLYGLTARANGKHQEAIFAFERVVINRSKNINARMALAVAYYEIGNYEAARAEFNHVLSLNPDTATSLKVDEYIKHLNNLKNNLEPNWSGLLSASVGYDSNVNSGLGDEMYEIPIQGILREFQFPEAADSMQRLNARLKYEYPLSKHNALYTHLAAGKTFYSDLKDLEKANMDFMLGYQHKIGAAQIKTSGFYQKFWFGSEVYQNLYAALASIDFEISNTQNFILSANYSITDNQLTDNLDLNSSMLKAQYSYLLDFGKFSIHASYRDENVDQLNESSQHYERDVTGIGLSWLQPIADWGILSFAWRYQHAKHQFDNMTVLDTDGFSPLFKEKRSDHSQVYNIAFDYLLSARWSWQTQARISRKNSNQFFYSFNRNLISTGVRYTF
ncbi:porin family protein [Catenovulum sediminis]|uniref:Porin family protein n=1 Tax=Catenovulum sediminis TaxID=1740262 RepID=A0ABV1RDP9_9ALTE